MRKCQNTTRQLFIFLFLITQLFVYSNETNAAPQETAETTLYELSGEPIVKNQVDKHVFAKLKELDIPPSRLCSDTVFIRRVYLDVTGTLPRPNMARRFLNKKDPEKRAKLIDTLLASDEHAFYLAMKWCDLLRVNSEFPNKVWPNAVQAYYRWILDAMQSNMPYDTFARTLLTASGSNFRYAPVNFYRAVKKKAPREIAEAVALTFMGIRLDKMDASTIKGMSAFFSRIGYKSTSEWKEEIVFFDRGRKLSTNGKDLPYTAGLPDGKNVNLSDSVDPRLGFADWLITPENKWFCRNIVNRLWYWLMGRGIIHEPDDIRPDNPAQNPALLSFLEKELHSHNYDLKHIYRLILNSSTYQLSSVPNEKNAQDEINFSHYLVRRMEAEVLIDTINRITRTSERYHSKVPEPFTWVPRKQPTVALADGTITSPFLDMFGRPNRATGYETERNNNPTARQKLHLLNSSHIQRKIERSRALRNLAQKAKSTDSMLDAAYLTILSRLPTDQERKIAKEYINGYKKKKRDAQIDIVWALFNTKEFLYKH